MRTVLDRSVCMVCLAVGMLSSITQGKAFVIVNTIRPPLERETSPSTTIPTSWQHRSSWSGSTQRIHNGETRPRCSTGRYLGRVRCKGHRTNYDAGTCNVAMSASSPRSQPSPGAGGPWAGGGWDGYSAPTGPGAAVLDLKFSQLKTGGFKVFLFFFLLGQGRAKDNDVPFQVLDTAEGIRLLIGREEENSEQWDGVLDLSWGMDPEPFFRVDRIDVNEVIPYPGELYILNKLLDAIIDINGEQAIGEKEKLFLFPKGDTQLADMKAKFASLASLSDN